MNKISSITRKQIFDVLLNTYSMDNLLGYSSQRFNFWGTLMPAEFLERLYDLEKIPSLNIKFKNAKEELQAFKVEIPKDLQWDWLFNDDRFPIKNGSDEDLLDFICTVLHPEVRDEKTFDLTSPLWDIVYQKLNMLIASDGYCLIVDGHISNHFVYSWVDREKHSLQTIKNEKTSPFINLFMRNGGVLDFSTNGFASFCNDIIGISLCPIYNASKTKSFSQFIYEGSDDDIKKLLVALFDYYEQSPKYRAERINDSHYENMYKICKRTISNFDSYNALIDSYTKELLYDFSTDYMRSQIRLMMDSKSSNPTEAIGKAKELIESCCNTILMDRKQEIDKDWNLGQLVKTTQKVLHIMPVDMAHNVSGSNELRVILNDLSSLAFNLALLRNIYGTGHGKDLEFKGLEERHAELAIGCNITLVKFLWASHLLDKE
ncbi:MAG: abortive infection family protein [Prevotella sp.]|nr:abortive infection family protein [Prevotella sp.]